MFITKLLTTNIIIIIIIIIILKHWLSLVNQKIRETETDRNIQ